MTTPDPTANSPARAKYGFRVDYCFPVTEIVDLRRGFLSKKLS
jgi:hypothetical protein